MLKKWSVLVVLISIFGISCSKYQKLLKSGDMDAKYQAGVKYYEEEKWDRAMTLFEELIPLYRGTDRAEEVYYMYSHCNYNLSLYYASAYHFKKYAVTYPMSDKAGYMLFMHAYSNYVLSPIPSLDATNTKKAINSFQLFINTYPEHELVDSSNVMMDKLRAKLEEKSFQNSKQYYKIYAYKSAIIALNNTLEDFPETEHREEILLLILKSNYYLAENSVEKKKLERINNTIEAYYTFVDTFKDSKYIKEAQLIYSKASKMRDEFKLKNS